MPDNPEEEITQDEPTPQEHGCYPLGDGRWLMVPSGDIVDHEERKRRLKGQDLLMSIAEGRVSMEKLNAAHTKKG